MKTTKSLALSAIIILSTSIACTREGTTRRQHAPSGPSEVTQDTRPAYSAAEIKAATEGASDFVSIWTTRLSNLESEARGQTLEQRESFHKLADRASKIVDILPSEDETRKAVLNAFIETAELGCESTTSNQLQGCLYNGILRQTPASASLALAGADAVMPDLERRYRLLSIAFSTVNRVDDTRLVVSYLTTAVAYEKLLENKTKENSTRVNERLEQHREIIDQALNRILTNRTNQNSSASKLSLTDAQFAALEKEFNIWDFKRDRNNSTAHREEALLSLTAHKLFQNQALFDRLISETKTASNSAIKRVSNVSHFAKQALGIKETLPADVHTLIFEGIWHGDMNMAEANIIWDAYLKHRSDQSPEVLRETAQQELLNYARTRLLVSAQDVNNVILDFFNTPGKFATSNAFQEGMKEGLKGKTMWSDATRRLDFLRQFHERNFRTYGTAGLTGGLTDGTPAKSIQDLDMFFASIDRNIKLLSTYPSMLVMSYHLARLGFSMRAMTWTGPIEIRAGQILDWFFSGQLSPWLPYGSDFRSLSKSEIALAYYYALETGVLDRGGVDLDTLFKMLAEQMTGTIRTIVENINDGFKLAFESNPLIGDFQRICAIQEQRSAAGSSRTVSPPINLTNLRKFTLTGLPQGVSNFDDIHPAFNAAWSFFETERTVSKMRLDENLEVVRLEMTPKIDTIRILARLSEDYLNRHQIKNRTEQINQVNLRIRPLEDLRKSFYTRIFRLMKSTSECGEKLSELELDNHTFVLNGLISHFRDVHAAMKTARSTNQDNVLNKQFGFERKVNMPEISEHETGLGFTHDTYRASRLQTLLRITEILEQGYVDAKTKEKLAPRRDVGSIRLPTRLRDIQAEWRNEGILLEWTPNVDEFVTDGIQQMFDTRTGYIMWPSLNMTALSTQYRIRSMSALAKAGTVETDDGPQRLQPKELIRIALKMQKWLEVNNSTWAGLLNVTGRFSRVDLAMVLDDFAWNKSDRAWIGVLDYMFAQVIADKLGAGEEGEGGSRFHSRVGLLQELRAHSRVTRSFGEPALNIPPGTLKELTAFYTRALDQQMNLIAEIITEVDQLQPSYEREPEKFPAWRLFSSRQTPPVPLLSDSAVELFRSEIYEFGRQTGYVVPENAAKKLAR